MLPFIACFYLNIATDWFNTTWVETPVAIQGTGKAQAPELERDDRECLLNKMLLVNLEITTAGR